MNIKSGGATETEYNGLLNSMGGLTKQLEKVRAVMTSDIEIPDVSHNLLVINRGVDRIQRELNKIATKIQKHFGKDVGKDMVENEDIRTITLGIDEFYMLYDVFCKHNDGSNDSAKQFSLFL